MLQRLTETKTGVDQHPLSGNALAQAVLISTPKELRNFSHHLFITWIILHSLWHALHVHQCIGHIRIRYRCHHTQICSSADVINHVRACVDGGFGGFTVACVHGNNAVQLFQSFYHRQHPTNLFCDSNSLCTGTTRFSADIQHRSTFIDHALSINKNFIKRNLGVIIKIAAIGERIGGDIQHPHNLRVL